MAENTEVVPPQNLVQGTPSVEEVVVAKTDLEELQHRAEVSSQNFERLKKSEKDNEELRLENERLKKVPSGTDAADLAPVLAKVTELEGKVTKSEVIETYPELKELWSDLEKFREEDDNKGMSLKTAAKSFLVEKGLLNPQRKGLEKTTGGPKISTSTGMSAEDVKTLREQNPKKYRDMLKKGLIEIS